nr:hypothetical protein [Tanacetum cinerariifolium]
MDGCHLLVGRPWEYDRNTTHNGRANTYSFMFDGVKITLMPNKPKELVNKPTGKEVAKDREIPTAMIPLLEEFSNVFPDELHDGLPPLHDIKHQIDLETGLQLPNRPHYRMSLGENEELRRQINGETIFMKLDLKSGYYQIRLRSGGEWKTAFKTCKGLYEWYWFASTWKLGKAFGFGSELKGALGSGLEESQSTFFRRHCRFPT